MNSTERSTATDRPPNEVIVACVAIVATAIIACVLRLPLVKTDEDPRVIEMSVIAVATWLVVWGLLRRREWLREILVVWYVFVAIMTGVAIVARGFASAPMSFVPHATLQLLAAVMLMRPASRAWFRGRTST